MSTCLSIALWLAASVQATTVPREWHYEAPKLHPSEAEVARSVAMRLLPPGSMRSHVENRFDATSAEIMHEFMMLPVEEFAREMRIELPPKNIVGGAAARVRISMLIDPHGAKRAEIAQKTIKRIVAEAAAKAEPRIREALAAGYSAELTLDELKALDRFLVTPAGAAYARASLVLDQDPSLLAAKASLQRSLADAKPSLLDQLTSATSSLPKPRTAAQLSADERMQILDAVKRMGARQR